MARDKLIYRETYKAGVMIPAPTLNHTTREGEKFVATGCELRASGVIKRNGEEVGYHDLRVYVKTKK
jgi:hypothetical protein